MVRVTIFNSLNYPNMHRVFDYCAGHLPIELSMISCIDRPPNRHWPVPVPKHYRTRVLKGTYIKLNDARYAYINRGIWKALNEASPDILIIDGTYPSMTVGRLWSQIHSVPLVFQSDGPRSTMPMTPYHRIVRPWIFRGCKAFFCTSAKGEQFYLEEGFSRDQLFRWPLVPMWDMPRTVRPLEERAFDVLWCAQVNRGVKNVGFFVDTVIKLHERMPSLRVRIVGKGPELENVLNRLSASNVNFVHDGFIPSVEEAFSSSRLLLLPSLWEPWGLVCNEAMQCGTVPIVSPFVEAGNDLVVDGENGRILPLDADLWATVAEDLLVSPQVWSTYSSAARKSMESDARTLDCAAKVFYNMIQYVQSGIRADEPNDVRLRTRRESVDIA